MWHTLSSADSAATVPPLGGPVYDEPTIEGGGRERERINHQRRGEGGIERRSTCTHLPDLILPVLIGFLQLLQLGLSSLNLTRNTTLVITIT